MNILEKYLSEKNLEPNFLDKVTKEFALELVNFINEEFIKTNISDSFTRKRLRDNVSNLMNVEYNTLCVPYFYILENINLCVEVEMSAFQASQFQQKKFAETKFSQILENGLQGQEPIKRFSVSEKNFTNKVISFIDKYTKNYSVDVDLIKIEFN